MKTVKYLFLDVDGTLTDGKIYMSSTGELFKAFSVKDGYALNNLAKENGILPIIVTGRESEIVRMRCRELGIEKVFQGVPDKAAFVQDYMKAASLEQAAMMGDDIPDLGAMRLIRNGGGLAGCPFDAAEQVKKAADFVAPHKGGEGAVRDFIEWIIEN